jgi:hypothetical protein
MSCNQEPQIEIFVVNKSDIPVDSIQVRYEGYNRTFSKHLAKKEKEKFVVDFSNVPKNDGSIIFQFYLHDGSTKKYDDYYTNGGKPTDHYNFEILANTVKVKSGGFFW